LPCHTPIYTALKKYMAENNLRLHMPGHGGENGSVLPELEAVMRLDVTEVEGLDDLHLAQGVIKEAQQLLARACGASESFLLLNGATSGIHALFMSLGEGQVMVPRNAHRSFYEGMVLSGAMPVYIPCELDPELGVALAVRADKIEALLNLHKDMAGVFITSPSYYGTCCDIAGISSVIRRAGKILLVDEAQGAHFPFHPLYPTPALKSGADAVVNGLHKSWPVLTQGACMHLSGGFFLRDQLRAAYSLLTTSSPSYPLMASIDGAREFMEQQGKTYLEKALGLSREYKTRLNQIPGLRCYEDELLDIPGVKAIDPLKVLIGVRELGLTGYQVSRILREEYRIQVEMQDHNLILAMFSLLHPRETWEKFYRALQDLTDRYRAANSCPVATCIPPSPTVVLSPRKAFYSRSEKLKLTECRGRVCAELIAAYPPGIPCLVPGELINDEIWDYLYYLRQTGACIQGPEDRDLEYIKVIE